MEKIEKETNGRVKFKPYWGGQVIGGLNAVDELAAGVADIAYIQPNNTKTGFALCKVMQLFFAGADWDSAVRAWKQLRVKFPEIDKEYADAKVKPLQDSATTSELLTRKPVRKLEDLKGTRIRVVGGDLVKVLKTVGAEGITTSTSEMYTGLQKGIIDGIFGLTEGLESLKLADVIKYVTMYDSLQAPYAGRAMNLDKWKSLPPDIQKVFENNVDFWSKATEESLSSAGAHALDYAKKRGVEAITVSKEEKERWNKLLLSVAEKNAKELDAKGFRATQILQETQRLIRQNGK